ncbi:MAG: glutaredoxin 2 [Pseudomonadota bacterium]
MRLFIYQCCPYCSRCRLMAAHKRITLDLSVLAFDDIQAHVDLIGKKILPILEYKEGCFMTETAAICEYLDAFDGKPDVKPVSFNDSWSRLIEDLSRKSKYLIFPRQIIHPMNHDDFPTQAAKDYCQQKKEVFLQIAFEQAWAKSDDYVSAIMPMLNKLDSILTHQYATSDEFSYDDILIFPILRLLTLAADVLQLPDNMMSYIQRVSKFSKIALYPECDYSMFTR